MCIGYGMMGNTMGNIMDNMMGSVILFYCYHIISNSIG